MQTEVFISKEFFLQTFELEHGTSIEDIHVARAIVKGNEQIVYHFLSTGLLTEDQLIEIMSDSELQGQCIQMVQALNMGKKDAFNLLYDNIKYTPDTFCAWLEFYNQYLEDTLKISLISRTKDDYKYQMFLEEN